VGGAPEPGSGWIGGALDGELKVEIYVGGRREEKRRRGGDSKAAWFRECGDVHVEPLAREELRGWESMTESRKTVNDDKKKEK